MHWILYLVWSCSKVDVVSIKISVNWSCCKQGKFLKKFLDQSWTRLNISFNLVIFEFIHQNLLVLSQGFLASFAGSSFTSMPLTLPLILSSIFSFSCCEKGSCWFLTYYEMFNNVVLTILEKDSMIFLFLWIMLSNSGCGRFQKTEDALNLPHLLMKNAYDVITFHICICIRFMITQKYPYFSMLLRWMLRFRQFII